MSLLTWYQEWRADRLRKRREKDFEAGARYARECLRSNMLRPEVHLYNLTNGAHVFGDYSQFDAGIDAVLAETHPDLEDTL